MNNTVDPVVTTATDRITKNMAAIIAAAAKTASELEPLAARATELADDIQERQSQLAALDVQIGETERRQRAELRVRLVENADQVLNELLSSRSLARISEHDVREMTARIDGAEEAKAAAVAAAEKAVAGALHGTYRGQLTELEAKHRVDTAELTANTKSLMDRNNFLSQEVEQLRQQIADERNARIEIARSDATRQAVTVNAGKQ